MSDNSLQAEEVEPDYACSDYDMVREYYDRVHATVSKEDYQSKTLLYLAKTNRRVTWPDIEHYYGWKAHSIAGSFGGTGMSTARRPPMECRPFHIAERKDGMWEFWMDDTQRIYWLTLVCGGRV